MSSIPQYAPLVTVVLPQLRLVWAAPVGSPPPTYSVVGQSQLGLQQACPTARPLVTEQPGQGPGECGVAEGAVCYSNTCCGDPYVSPANSSVQYRICGTGRVACQVGHGGGARQHAKGVVDCRTKAGNHGVHALALCKHSALKPWGYMGRCFTTEWALTCAPPTTVQPKQIGLHQSTSMLSLHGPARTCPQFICYTLQHAP